LADFADDQAAGLRRMFFHRSDVPVIAFAAAPDAGVSELVCAYAGRLARRGLEVTLVDEHRAGTGAAALLQASTRFDLAQAAAGDVALSQVVVSAGRRLRLVAAARLAQHDGGDAGLRLRLAQCMRLLTSSADVLLVDAAGGEGGRLSTLAAKAGSLVAVSGSSSTSVTATYLMLRQIAPARPQLRLALAVCPAASERQAVAIFDNMRDLLRRQLGRELQACAWWTAQHRDEGDDRLLALDTLLPPTLRQEIRAHDEAATTLAAPSPQWRRLRLAAVNSTRD
jgi:MinD-like ATPase involved in chromosome partitioning or flagellar assembly